MVATRVSQSIFFHTLIEPQEFLLLRFLFDVCMLEFSLSFSCQVLSFLLLNSALKSSLYGVSLSSAPKNVNDMEGVQKPLPSSCPLVLCGSLCETKWSTEKKLASHNRIYSKF